ncbi:hypothetical protein A2803_04680 [Candidatus Woesebacteria bacterium RIFCSPHIGHO2_01_FULL_44_21]|uniref:Uncharacterized protein n=1 Tax=Candidatus Woesebacteria bacterium RIFCSPHIGHO2_01_FULL_44_21 TaxID=1802503 RepID=A0A1F7Z1L9_9BACT|nr:MAG: hypothetical protein A2803_04680 [Candidatus Woesebacteria bacterium RIFCSPHIGHO2_01_FULL_44_21]OGM69413.1 MAG: hypothetical protein A2897_03610 [Candidatus Woesebacteria bacterium RIFCSPLOWO2_01_FULL_44_24b]
MELINRDRGGKEIYDKMSSFRAGLMEAADVSELELDIISGQVIELDKTGHQVFYPSVKVVAAAYGQCERNVEIFGELSDYARQIYTDDDFRNLFGERSAEDQLDIAYYAAMALKASESGN